MANLVHGILLAAVVVQELFTALDQHSPLVFRRSGLDLYTEHCYPGVFDSLDRP
jgi:hypothetical protein